MNYIKLFIFAIFISSCATTTDTDSSIASAGNPLEQSDEERKNFKQALSLLNSEKLEAAKEKFLELNNDRPELAGPYANLAIIALKNNEPGRALELVNKALSKNPNLAQALNLLAYLEQVSGEIQKAEKHYKEAIKNKNNYAIAHYNLALLYDIYLQDIEKAIPHYEAYMKIINNDDKNTADWLEQIKRKSDNG